MKLIKLKNSILIIKYNIKTDSASCLFLFFVSWNCIKIDRAKFDFETLSMSQIKEFYKKLAYDWLNKYTV